ncbi:MAG TPA: hypothetical protein VGS80_18605 [Ktedonobacterales bacterium]|nr:hypothetical protein [Ktedonobacterales bacterium]
MPRVCTICSHPQRPAIDAALVASTPYRAIARRFRVSKDAVARHGAEHIPAAISHAQEAREEAQALDVVKQLKAINGVALEILNTARRQSDPDIALKAIDRIHRQIELQAKLLGDLDELPIVNVLLSPEWVTVRSALMAALALHAQARQDVVTALVALEEGNAANGGINVHQ